MKEQGSTNLTYSIFSFVFLPLVSTLAIRDFTFMGRSISAAHRLSHWLPLFSRAAFCVICWSIHTADVIGSSLASSRSFSYLSYANCSFVMITLDYVT
ncbi:hypothetical protein BDW67DRAFT_15244 [Aspergillus spinulosporus]